MLLEDKSFPNVFQLFFCRKIGSNDITKDGSNWPSYYLESLMSQLDTGVVCSQGMEQVPGTDRNLKVSTVI